MAEKPRYSERGEAQKRMKEVGQKKIKQFFGRIRCGHAKELKSYQKRIGLTDCGACTYCDMDEQETVEHVLCKSPQLELARRELWPDEFNMKMMVINPDVCLKLLGRRYQALRRPPIGESSEPSDHASQQD